MPYEFRRALPLPPDVEPIDWEFALTENVQLIMTGETGFVSGRKEEIFCEDQYEITYVNAAGCLVKKWWPEGALEPISAN